MAKRKPINKQKIQMQARGVDYKEYNPGDNYESAYEKFINAKAAVQQAKNEQRKREDARKQTPIQQGAQAVKSIAQGRQPQYTKQDLEQNAWKSQRQNEEIRRMEKNVESARKEMQDADKSAELRRTHDIRKLDPESLNTLMTLYKAEHGVYADKGTMYTQGAKPVAYVDESTALGRYAKKQHERSGQAYVSINRKKLEEQFKRDNGVGDKGFKLYQQYLKEAMNTAEAEDLEKISRDYADKHPIAANATDVVVDMPAGFMATAESVRHKFDADPYSNVNTNSALYRAQNFQNAVENQTNENIAAAINNPYLRTAAQVGYGAGLSTAKMVAPMALGGIAGGIAEGTGAGELGVKLATNAATLPSFGASAYSHTLKEAQDRGLSKKQATQLAVVSAVSEMGTEVVSLDVFWDIAKQSGVKAARNRLVNWLVMSVIEGSEEGANDTINRIADDAIAGDQSEYNSRVRELMENEGLTEEEAKKVATHEYWAQLGTDVLAGSLSGGLMGGGATYMQSRSYAKTAKHVNAGDYMYVVDELPLEESAYENKEGSDAAKEAVDLAQELAKKAEEGTEVTKKEKTRLVELVDEARQNMSVRSEEAEAPAEEKRSKAQIMADMSQAKNARELTKAYHEAVENIPAENRRDADNLFNIKAGQLNLTTAQVNSARMSDADVYNAGYENKRIDHLTPQQQVTYREGAMKRFEEEAKARAAAEVTGKASNDAGKEFTVKEIKSLDSKDMTLLTDDGEVKLSQVKFSNDGEQTLYNQAAQMGSVAAAKAYVDNYVPGMPVDAYDRVAQKFYTAGQLRTSFDSMRIGPVEKQVGTEGLRALYDAGMEVDKAESKIAKKTTTAKKGEGRLIDSRENKGETLHRGFLRQLAEKLGIDVELKDTDTMAKEYVKAQEEEGKTIDYETAVSIVENQNGMFEPAMGRLILNADNPDMYKTLFHELSEFGQAYNAEGMDELRIAMMEYMMEKAPDSLRQNLIAYQNAYRQHTDEKTKSISEASEELFNDMLSEIFRDEASIQDFVNWVVDTKTETEAQGLIQRLAELIQKICDSIYKFVSGNREMSSAQKVAAKMDVQRAQEMRSKLLQAFDEAIKNRDALVGQEGQAEVRHSLEVDTEGRKLAPRVKKFFRNSKLVDEQGRLKEMYHGTRYAGFTVFQLAQMDDGMSIFLTDKNKVAKTYAGTYDFYEPDRKWSFNELETAVSYATGGDWEVEQTDSGVRITELGFVDQEEMVHDFDTTEAAQDYFINNYLNKMDLKSSESAAVYRVYGNATNPLIVDADNNNWDELPVNNWNKHYGDVNITKDGEKYQVDYMDGTTHEWHNEVIDSFEALERKFGKIPEQFQYDTLFFSDLYLDKDGNRIPTNTREYAQYAKAHGYDSVIIQNVVDSGLYGNTDEQTTPSTVAILFNPNQVKSIYNQNPTENEDIRYSIDVQPERVFYTKAGTEVVQNPTSQEYSQMREDILQDRPWLRGSGEPLFRHTYDEQGNEYYWDAMGGLHAQVEPEINKKYNTRTSQQWNWWTREDKDDYPVDYGTRYSIELGDVEKEAIEHFGTTDNFRVAGYMLQDGTMLDFSGAHWLDGESPEYIADWKRKNDIRQVDHEDITEVFDDEDAYEKMVDERGNIRMMPESPGVSISSTVEPTAAQYRQLKEFIRETKSNPVYNNYDFFVDIGAKSPQKLAYRNNINEDRVVNDIKRYYETGEVSPSALNDFRYSLGGIAAETADRDALKEAQDMFDAEMPMEDIFKKTGWYLGADNRWKFEISNENSEVHPYGYARSMDDPTYHRWIELRQKINNSKELSDEEFLEVFTEFDKLSKEYQSRRGKPLKLVDVLKNDELFKAYPSLARVTVEYKKNTSILEGYAGQFDRNTMTITVDDEMSLNAKRSTILHEVQHAIQYLEGFARGSNLSYWSNFNTPYYIDKGDQEKYDREKAILEDLRERAPKDFITKYDKQRELLKQYYSTNDESILDKVNEICVELTKENNGLLTALEDAEFNVDIYEPQLKEMLPSEAYYATAGEIEAREVQNRLEMSAEQRKNTLPKTKTEKGMVVFSENYENPLEPPYQYKKRYSLNVVDVLQTREEREMLNIMLSDAKQKYNIPEKGANGEYIFQIYNKLIYNKGTRPNIKQFIEINTYPKEKDLTTVSFIQKEFIENEKTKRRLFRDLAQFESDFARETLGREIDITRVYDSDFTSNAKHGLGDESVVWEKVDRNSEYSKIGRGSYGKSDKDSIRYALNIDNDFGMWDTEDLQGTFIDEDGQELDLGNSVINAEETISGLARYLQAANEPLKGHKVNASALQQIAEDLVKKYNSTADVNVVADNLKIVFDYLQKTDDINYNEITKLLSEVSRPIIEQSGDVNEEMVELYEAFKSYIKTQKIALTDGQKKAFDLTPYGSFNNYRKANFGTLNFVNDGASLDSLWTEMCEKAKGFLDVDTNEEDMGIALADALTAMKPQAESLYGYDAREASIDLAGQIMEAYYKAEQEAIAQDMVESGMASPTAKYMIESARKDMKKEIMDYRKKTKELYNKQLEDMQGKISEIMAANNALAYDVRNLEKKNEQLTKKMAEQVVKAKARNKTTELKRYVEAEEIKKQKEEINKIAIDLLNRATNPTNKKYMQEGLRKPIAEFLTGIDFVSHRARLDSKNTVKWTDRMQALRKYLSNAAKGDEPEAIGIVLDPDLIEDIDRFATRNSEVAKVSKLPSWDLKELHSILSRLRTAVNKSNEMFTNELYKNQEDFNQAAYSELKEQNSQKNINKFMNSIRDFLNKDLEDPVTYFELLGETHKTLFDSLLKGFDKRAEHIREYVEFMKKLQQGKEQFYKWENKKHTFQLEEGTLEITEAQIMSLYETMQREQAKGHILPSGFKVSKVTVGGKEIIQNKPVRIKPAEYLEIINTLSAEQKEVADAIQKFMAVNCAKWGNNTSMKLFGYKKFNEKNYFPIKTDATSRDTNQQDVSKQAGLWANKNMSASKELTIGANNAIVIGDIFDVFADHVTDMATYDGMVLPQMDAMRWFNYRAIFKGENETGEIKDTYSIKEQLQRLMGTAGTKYFENLMLGINGMEPKARSASAMTKFIGNYKKAAVTAKIRVAIQQPTAIIRAMDEMNGKYISKALATTNFAKYSKIAQEKSNLAWWKAQGYYEAYLGKSIKDMAVGKNPALQAIDDYAGFGAQKADDLTWGALYHAVEYEIADTTDLKPGTEAFDAAVVDRFEDVVTKTQVVDTMIHRTDIMRNQNDFVKLATSFMAEPLKTYNMCLRSIAKYARAPRDKKMWRKLMRTLIVYTLNNAILTAVTSSWDAVRDDDDKTPYSQRWISRYSKEFIDNMNPVNMLPYVKDVVELFESRIKGEYYSSTDMATAGFDKAATFLVHLGKVLSGEKINKTPYGLTLEGLQAIQTLSGMPIYNVVNDINTVHNGLTDNWETKQSTSDYGDLHKAITKDKDVKEEVQDLLEMGKDKSGIKSSITGKFKEEYQEATGEDKQQIRESVTEALVEAGYTQEEAQNTLDKWDGIETTKEPQYEEYHSDYESVYDAIDKGGDVQGEVQKMLDSGKQPRYVKSSITNRYKDQLVQTRDANLRNALVRAYMAAGDTNEEANEKIESWFE